MESSTTVQHSRCATSTQPCEVLLAVALNQSALGELFWPG
jgi:hypothetical protein